MKKRGLLSIVLTCIIALSAVYTNAAPFTDGNILVLRVGDGAATLVNTGAAVFLDEYTPAGVLVQTISVPTTNTVSDNCLILSGTSTSEGDLANPPNLKYAVLAGYNRTLGTLAGSISATAADTVPRVVALVAADGSININSAFTDFSSGNNPRSAICNNAGDTVWMCGGTGGLRVAPVSLVNIADTSLQLSTTVTNLRDLRIFNDQLYVSTGSGSNKSVLSVGTGLPVITGQTLDPLPGLPTSGSPYSYYFADINPDTPGYDVLYIADDGSPAITKYTLVGGSWTAAGSIGVNSDDYRGMVGITQDTLVTLYLTRKGGSGGAGGGELVSLTDSSGYFGTLSATVNILDTAITNTSFRGICFAPLQFALSIKLLSFNAGPKDGIVKVWWSTANESGVKNFTVERSVNGKNFASLGDVAASNSSSYSYVFNDKQPLAGISYYRLKVNEANGTHSYSSVVKVETKQNSLVSVSPNPVKGSVVITHAASETAGTVGIYSLDGKMLLKATTTAGSTQSTFDVSKLAPGIYIAVYDNMGDKTTVRFVRQ
ncbi:MAG: hypothetical protein BGO69_07440 [Bacteroidetes bacterium 46-16]|nr:MAG: hypothetical protein BGO69_07440 [Bacteroidetes bacterium 46-16]